MRYFLMAVILMLFTNDVFASHFRYGNITWERVTGNANQIKFTVTECWRRSAYGGSPGVGSTVSTGSFTPNGVNFVNVSLQITSVNTAEDWMFGTFTYIYTYPAGTATYTAYTRESCCRLSTLANNRDLNYKIVSTVTKGNNNDAPVSTLPPIVNLPTNQTAATYQIPVADPNGDALTFSATPAGTAGVGTSNPTGFSVDSNGLISFNTVGKAVGSLWSANVTITDSKGAKVMLDFLIRVTNTSTPPVFDYTVSPANNVTYLLQPGQPLSFNVKASDADAGNTVNLSAVGLPVGSSFTSGTGNPVTRSFSWTPTSSQLGTYLINFVAQDNVGIQTNTIVKVVVSMKPTFDMPTPGNNSLFCAVPGIPISQTFKASDPDTADRVILSATGGISGMSFSPALPTVAANPTSTSFSWTPTAAEWGLKQLVLKATDTYNESVTDTIYYVVNNKPVITSTPPAGPIYAGQPFSYTITATDANAVQGDTISIESTVLPSFLSIVDNNNGTFTISGTPTMADSGTYNLNVELQDKMNHIFGSHCGHVHHNFSLTVVPCNAATSYTATQPACPGGSDGSIAVTATNVASPVQYSIDGGISYQSSNSFSGLTAGNYSIKIVDANNCTATETGVVSAGVDAQNPTIAAPANATVSCQSATTPAASGTATGSDNCSSVTITYADASTQNPNTSTAGHYNYTITRTWTATDATGNATSYDQIITVNALHNAAIAVTPVNTINSNHANYTIYRGYGPQTVTLSASASGGIGSYSYSWTPTVASPSSAATTVSPTVTTTYTVTITDATGCSIQKSITINVIDVRCGEKIQICHYPQGNVGNPQQLCLPVSAIAAHLAHGCRLGACAQLKGEPTEDASIAMSTPAINEVKVYPNPNTGVFSVDMPAGANKADVLILDMAGKVIERKSVTESGRIQFDLGNIARGCYMIQVSGDVTFRSKIVIQ